MENVGGCSVGNAWINMDTISRVDNVRPTILSTMRIPKVSLHNSTILCIYTVAEKKGGGAPPPI